MEHNKWIPTWYGLNETQLKVRKQHDEKTEMKLPQFLRVLHGRFGIKPQAVISVWVQLHSNVNAEDLSQYDPPYQKGCKTVDLTFKYMCVIFPSCCTCSYSVCMTFSGSASTAAVNKKGNSICVTVMACGQTSTISLWKESAAKGLWALPFTRMLPSWSQPLLLASASVMRWLNACWKVHSKKKASWYLKNDHKLFSWKV